MKIISLFLLLPISLAMDGILITSVEISMSQQFNGKSCDKISLEIAGKSFKPLCESPDGSNVYLSYNGTEPITPVKNVTLLLTSDVKNTVNTTISANFTGLFNPETTTPMKLAVQSVTLSRDFPATTTAAPTTPKKAKEFDDPPPKPTEYPQVTQATLKINYIHMQYDENPKKPKQNNNGGAVTVAIIEGIALIAILAYAGYRTMVASKRKQTANLYGYDNNSRITVPDNIRMSDIPPPRDATYATPPASQPPRPTLPVLSTPDLVVPASRTQGVSPAAQGAQSQPGAFSDPFESLESW